MDKTVVLLGIPGSSLTEELSSHIKEKGLACHALSLDAPFEGKPVTLSAEAVLWEGIDLSRADAVFVESPVFSWPQPEIPPGGARADFSYKAWAAFQREARSLVVSAVSAAGETGPVINAPWTAQLAVAPTIALDLLAKEGIPVHPWRLEPAPEEEGSHAGYVVDSIGRNRWHVPHRPAAGEPALVIEPFDGEVETHLVIGEESIGVLRHHNGETWAKGGGEPGKGVPEAQDLALRAARALSLEFASVSIGLGTPTPSVLLCQAGPDPAAWNQVLDGRVAPALADRLAHVALNEKGVSL